MPFTGDLTFRPDYLICDCSRKRGVEAFSRQNSKSETRLHIDNGNRFPVLLARLKFRVSRPVARGGF
jgi:hypothetical protein